MSVYGHGLTRREQQIMDLWDRGQKVADIAVELGLSPVTMEKSVTSYNNPSSAAFERMIRLGSQDLHQRTVRCYPERFIAGHGTGQQVTA